MNADIPVSFDGSPSVRGALANLLRVCTATRLVRLSPVPAILVK